MNGLGPNVENSLPHQQLRRECHCSGEEITTIERAIRAHTEERVAYSMHGLGHFVT